MMKEINFTFGVAVSGNQRNFFSIPTLLV